MRILGKRTSNEEPVTVSDLDWRHHSYAIGGTGTGKTTWLESLMAQDLSQGRGFCYIDKHGDSAKRIADSSPEPVVYWRPADLAFPIGLNPLQNVAPDERWRVTADIVSVFSDIWKLGPETPRLLYYLRAAVRLLLDSPGTTLLDIRRVLSDDRYRSQLLRKCSDSETRQTWEEFSHKDARQQAQEIGSLQNKVAALADALPLRLIIGQQTSTINIRRIIDSGTIIICDLSGIGEEPARLLGALLVSQFAQAAEARADTDESERKDYTLYIDEFQNFASLAFAKILSEARKWHLSIVLAHQFIAQISENGLHEAVLGNCGTVVSFRIGAEDARVIARAIGAPEAELTTLPRGRAYVRTLRDGQPTLTRPMRTERAGLGTGRLAAQVRNTRANFARPRKLAGRGNVSKLRDWR
jgi:DNA helicase HerA-like ATPase